MQEKLRREQSIPRNKKQMYSETQTGRETLRSMFERVKRKWLNSGSFWIFFHLPVPCLATPARSASSSSEVHFCFGFPIPLHLSLSQGSTLVFFADRQRFRAWVLIQLGGFQSGRIDVRHQKKKKKKKRRRFTGLVATGSTLITVVIFLTWI